MEQEKQEQAAILAKRLEVLRTQIVDLQEREKQVRAEFDSLIEEDANKGSSKQLELPLVFN